MASLIPKGILVFSGVAFLALAWWLPNRMEQMREHGGTDVGAYFTPGFQSLGEALGSIITAFSILSSVALAIVILPLEKKKSTVSTLLAIATLLTFSSGIVWSLYLSLARPLTGTTPSPQEVYWSLRLLLLGLSFTVFTLVSFVG